MDRFLVQKINHDLSRFEWILSCTYVSGIEENPGQIFDVIWTSDITIAFDFENEQAASLRACLIENANVVRNAV